MRTARFLKNGLCYRIHCRGRDGQKLFGLSADYEKYLDLVVKNKRRYRVHVYAYCLLPSETHLILHPADASKLPAFMQGVSQAYAKYFNINYRRTGAVWRDRYRSSLILEDRELMRAVKELEFLPVRFMNTVRTPTAYPWSSCCVRVDKTKTVIDDLPPVGSIFQ